MKKTIVLLVTAFITLPVFAGDFAVNADKQISFTATTTSSLALAGYNQRTYVLIINTGATSITVTFGGPQKNTEGVIIPAGGNYEPAKGVRDSIYIKSASSTDVVNILTGN